MAIGIRCSGHKEILGLWIEQTDGAKFWLRIMIELKNRRPSVSRNLRLAEWGQKYPPISAVW